MNKIKTAISTLRNTNRNVLLLIGGQSISRLGDSIQLVALFWLIYTLTGSESLTSMVALASTLPVVILGFYSGAIVDKYDRRTIIIISDIVQAVLYVIMPVLYYLKVLQIWHLFVIIFLIGISRTFFYPALRSILPSIVEKEQLATVNSVYTMCSQAARMIGPVLAGFLTYYIGSINLFVLNSLTFIVSVVTILRLTYRKDYTAGPAEEEEEELGIWLTIVEGFKYVLSKKVIFYLIITFPLFTLISAGLTDIALLTYVKEILRGTSIQYGLLQSCISVGVFLGGFMTIRLKSWNKFTLFLLGIFLVGLDFAAFGFNSVFAVSLGLMTLLGIAFVVLEICMVTLIQENVPDNMLGRVFSLWNIMGCGGDAISYIYIAGVLSIFSVGGAFILGGSVLLLGSLVGLFLKKRGFGRVEEVSNA